MKTKFTGTITVDETGIGYVHARSDYRWQARWGDIAKIAMWKHDCLTIDLLCLGFLVEGATHYEGCDEEAKGWDELQLHLLRRYNFKIEDWWDTVVMPPFAENFTIVWKR